jgi:hypothetical protein
MAWTKWTLVPKGIVGKTHHYWGLPAEVAPDAKRVDMPPARILLIAQDDVSDVPHEMPGQMKQAMEKMIAEFEARGTRVIRQESESEDVGLYRYADDGEFAGDTLHDNLEAAFAQANWEYDSTLVWHNVPAPLKHADVDGRTIQMLLESIPN